jgi:tripartite-type tricarboxylate transporter receptor subunit TctC
MGEYQQRPAGRPPAVAPSLALCDIRATVKGQRCFAVTLRIRRDGLQFALRLTAIPAKPGDLEMRRYLAPALSDAAVFISIFASLTMVWLPGAALAQDWPIRPVKIVVPYGPGGISDVLARMTADRLSEMLGQRFVVETHPGANGAIGTEYAVRSTADGYTLYHAGGAEFSVVPLMQKLSYDPLKDLMPISMTAINGMALAINRDLPIHSLQEFIEYARANPGKINYGSVGHGSSSDLTPAAFAARTGLKLVDVPYTATPPSILAVVSGQIQMFFGNVSDIVGSARSGEVRLLAVSTPKRLPQFPDVPTVSETVPGFVMTGWNGYFAPTGTPRPIIEKLSKAIQEICRTPEMAQKMANLSLQAVSSTPEELAAAIQQDLPVYREAAEAAGIVQK